MADAFQRRNPDPTKLDLEQEKKSKKDQFKNEMQQAVRNALMEYMHKDFTTPKRVPNLSNTEDGGRINYS